MSSELNSYHALRVSYKHVKGWIYGEYVFAQLYGVKNGASAEECIQEQKISGIWRGTHFTLTNHWSDWTYYNLDACVEFFSKVHDPTKTKLSQAQKQYIRNAFIARIKGKNIQAKTPYELSSMY
jgi:hypothetical protein